MQQLFSWQFRPGKKVPTTISGIVKNLSKIDKLISEGAPDRPISEINKIDLSILRLAVFELIIEKDAPVKVIIDEAIELGKEFGSDSSSAFINGALGKVIEIKKIKI
ncbi:transcription antitermination factor NusB [Candidatus Daviesbacteria bacterium]|nr:transcription antitermination factor NusB [Candidatus Daviesbacteria bacterium]